VQIIVQNLIGTVFGRGFVSVTTPLSHSLQVVPGLFVAPVAAIAIVVAVVCFTGLTIYLSRTYTGMAMRALSENPDLIRVFGLDRDGWRNMPLPSVRRLWSRAPFLRP